MLGRLKVPEREGILRAIDGQHRLLALHADIERFGGEDVHVPAIIFDRLPEDHIVQMFVTINAKHTRLNASHLVSLSGRQLYRDEALAAAHDVVRALNEREDSPLHGEIKLLGVGTRPRGAGAARPGAEEALRRAMRSAARARPRRSARTSKQFFVNYFKQIAVVFGAAWNGRKYSIKLGDGAARLHPRRSRRGRGSSTRCTPTAATPGDRPRDRALGPPDRRLSASRPTARGSAQGTTVDTLSRELRLALQYPGRRRRNFGTVRLAPADGRVRRVQDGGAKHPS